VSDTASHNCAARSELLLNPVLGQKSADPSQSLAMTGFLAEIQIKLEWFMMDEERALKSGLS